MPKVRERSRVTQDFAVTPWQDKREITQGHKLGAPYIVEEAVLLVPTATTCPPTVSRDGLKSASPPQEEDVDTRGWFTNAPRHNSYAPVSAVEFSVDPTPPQIATQTHDEEGPRHRSVRGGHAGSGLEVTGLCQLAVTPAGRGMGHVFIAGTGNYGQGRLDCRRARCYGIAVRPVPPVVPPDLCTEDDGTDLLCARLTDFVGDATVDVLVARTGGDMCSLSPPKGWLLKRWFGDDFVSDSDVETGAGEDAAAGRRDWGEEGGKERELWSADEAGGADTGKLEDEDAAEDEFEGKEGGESEADAAPASDGWGKGEGLPCTADATAGPQSAADWLTWWLRQRGRRPAMELHFEPETLLSGAAALPKLAEFARPLLPPQLARATGGGLRCSGDTATIATDAGLAAEGQEAGEAAEGAPASARMEGWAGFGLGPDVEIEAVVCLGPITLRGFPWAFLRGPE